MNPPRGYLREMRWAELRQRALACVLGVGLVAGGLSGAVVVLIIAASAAQPPNELLPNGDPCCPIPDSWADVAVWSMGALAATALDMAVIVGGVACLAFAARSLHPSAKLRVVPLYAVVVVAVTMAGVLVARAH
jgi:hypothetical protein